MRKLVPTEKFSEELNSLDNSIKIRIVDAINGKIQKKPELGKPLRHDLACFFSEHVGKYRIIYQYDSGNVYLLRCRKRREGY